MQRAVGRFLDDLDFHLQGATEIVILNSQLRYEMEPGVIVTIPAGFDNDLASVPQKLRSLAPPWNQSARPGVLHDWLYRTGIYYRRAADRIFRQALRAEGVSRVKAFLMWRAVRRFAGPTWNRYREGE